MTQGPAFRRKRQAGIALALGLALLALGVIAIWRDAASDAPPDADGPVTPGWRAAAATASRIEIATADAQFVLERREGRWVMPSRGGYAVLPERIAELDAALSSLAYERAMTRDPEKFNRLTLGDPFAGGNGVRLTVLDDSDRPLADLIVGAARTEGSVYVRAPDGGRAYLARGGLPDLGDPGRWLGLDFWDIDPSAVARARIDPETGPDWAVQRAGLAQRNYELMEPVGWRLVTGGAANGVATAGARLRFRDVRPAAELTGAYAAGHQGATFSGLAYAFRFVAEPDGRWATVEVRALADDAEERAEHLTLLTQGWAFEVSEDAYERLTRPLDGVAESAD